MKTLTFGDRLQHAWSVFRNKNPSQDVYYSTEGASYSVRPDRPFFIMGNSKSILAPIYTRIAIDVSNLTFMEVLVDDNSRYLKKFKTGLTECLTIGPNIDQSAREFKQECVMSLLEEGCIAIVPTKTDIDPFENGHYKIEEMRVGTITEWFPREVRILLYNDETGLKEEIIYPKKLVAIVQNPFYAVMNESNTVISTVMRDFNYLDKVNGHLSSGKLNILLQMPFKASSGIKREYAQQHVKDIDVQMSTSEHGIAYVDATEKVIQLNRAIENNFVEQISYVMNLLYSQMGLTEAVMNGTAEEQEMLNYYNRAIEPIAEELALEMSRKFLTKTARSQGHAVWFFRDPFKLTPVEKLAEIVDKLTRNEILSTNETRAIIGYRPSDDPRANELRNKNLSMPDKYDPIKAPDDDIQNGIN